jgi:hypothetical protein
MRFAKLALAALMITSAAHAQVPGPDVAGAKSKLEAWFMGYEFVPTSDHYKALGPALSPALAIIAFDEAAHPLTRARAVSSMVHAPNDYTKNALVRLLEDEKTPSLLQRKAVLVLADLWGAEHLALVVNVFTDARADLGLREACARALRGMGPVAYPERDRLLAMEKSPTVRGLLLLTKRVGATE